MLATLVIVATWNAEAAVLAPQTIRRNAFLPSRVQVSLDASKRPQVGYSTHATSQCSHPIVHDVPTGVKHFFTAAYVSICRLTPRTVRRVPENTPGNPPRATRTTPVSARAEYMIVYDMNLFYYIVKSFSCQRQPIIVLSPCGLRYACFKCPTPRLKSHFEDRIRRTSSLKVISRAFSTADPRMALNRRTVGSCRVQRPGLSDLKRR